MYHMNKDEENECISQINQSLKQYENQLEMLPSEDITHVIIVRGRAICEMMAELLLKKEGHYDSDKRNRFSQNIESLYGHNIIPKECHDFLNLIIRYGNEVLFRNPSKRLVFSFLNAFNYFIQWFDNYYYQNYRNSFRIERCCELINSLTYDKESRKLVFDAVMKDFNSKFIGSIRSQESKTDQEIRYIKKELEHLEKEKHSFDGAYEKSKYFETSNKEQSANEEIRRLRAELEIKEECHAKQIEKLETENKEILKKLEENRITLERCLDILEETTERGKRVESKIDELSSKIDNISNRIAGIQSLAESQMTKAKSSQDIEEIIEMYVEECIKNIMEYYQNFHENQGYHIEKTRLIYSIGENGWNKLCEKSKTFLITSKVMYNHLIMMDDIIDYSGICVLVTKAVEVEIHKRFFTDFLDYLHGRYGNDYEKYPTALLYKKRKPLFKETFTMGSIAYLMCYYESRYDSDEEKANNKQKLMEYSRDCVFSKYREDEIERLLMKYAASIEEIREKYRNPSAHTNEIKRVDAEECFNLVLDVEKLLKKMLDSFDY